MFDTVIHDIMSEMGFPLHIINLILKIYGQQKAAVWLMFKVGQVRQGRILSLHLFNIYAEKNVREATEQQI